MEFTIYTLGDVESFRAALTAVSMLFNPSNTEGWVGSSGSLGLGYMAALALTIGLTIMLFQGVASMKFELGQLIIGIIIYVIMFVPKFSVNLEDYYTGTIQRVDDVPLGIALPGSAISAMTREISTQFNVAFSTTNPNYMGFTQSGFMTPLKILNQLRYGSSAFAQADPNLARTIQSFVLDCTAGRPEFNENEIRSKPNPMLYLTDTVTSAGINGITVIYSAASPNGTNTTCQAAAGVITAGLTGFYSTASIGASATNPTGLSKFAKMISTRVNSTSAQTGGGFTTAEYEDSFRALTQLSGAEAKAFAITTLTSGLITTARYCSNNSANEAELARCLPTIQAARQYEEDSAASGTLFQRTMLHSMSIMLFLFYCFAPIVALMVLALGQKGIKIMGGYMVFGVWTQSWLPVATIINYFIQQKVFAEFSKFGADPTQIMTIADAPAIYDMLATNVAVASDLMAATPILTLALLTGSFFALTGVATRVSGKDYYDEKANTSSLVSNGAVSANTSAFGGTMGLNSFGQGMSSGPGISRQATQTAMKSLARGYELSYDKNVGQAETEAYSAIFANEKTAADSWRVADSYGATNSGMFKAAFQKQYKMDDAKYQKFEADQRRAKSMGTSETVSDTDTAVIGGQVSLDAGALISGAAKAIPKALGGAKPNAVDPKFNGPTQPQQPGETGGLPVGANGYIGLSNTKAETKGAAIKDELRGTTGAGGGGGETLGSANAAGGEDSRSASYDKKLSYDKVNALNTALSEKYGKQSVSTSSQSLARAQKFKEMSTETDQAARVVGTTGSFSGTELANYVSRNDDFTQAVRQAGADANLATVGGFSKEVDKTLASFKGTALGEMDKDTQRDLATFYALEKTDQAAYARVAGELFDDNNVANFRPVDQDVAADMAIGNRLREEVLDKTPVQGPAIGTARNLAEPMVAAVPGGVAAADALRNEGQQVGAVEARHADDVAQTVAAGKAYVQKYKDLMDDPSYADVRGQAATTLAELEGKIPADSYQNLQRATNALADYTEGRGSGDGLQVIGTQKDAQTLAKLGADYRTALVFAETGLESNVDLSAKERTEAKQAINTSFASTKELNTPRRLTKEESPGQQITVGDDKNKTKPTILKPNLD